MHFDANSSQEQETEDNASSVLNDDLEAQAGTDGEYSATGRDHSTDERIGLRSGLLLHSNATFFQDLRRGGKAWNLSKGEMLRHKLWTTSGWIDFHINEKIGRWITG